MTRLKSSAMRPLVRLFLSCLAALLTGCGTFDPWEEAHALDATRSRNPETGVLIGAEAFSLPGGPKACLLLHGYEATPQMFRQLAEHLAAQGIAVSVPRLPGHGTTIDDLAHVTWQEWVQTAEQAYKELKASYAHVYIVGFSLGGTLTVELASRFHPDGIVLLAPFFKITPHWYYLLSPETLMRRADKRGSPTLIKNWHIDVRDKRMRTAIIHNSYTPVKTSLELIELADIAWARLDRVTCPTLIMHGRHDRVAWPEKSRQLIKLLGSQDKQLIELKDSSHLLTIDHDKKRVFQETTDFILSHP